MKLELTEQQARFIKTLLQDEVDNEEIAEERLYELKVYLGDKKGQEMYDKIYSVLNDTLNIFNEFEYINTENGYDMGLAQIIQDDIFEHIIEEEN